MDQQPYLDLEAPAARNALHGNLSDHTVSSDEESVLVNFASPNDESCATTSQEPTVSSVKIDINVSRREENMESKSNADYSAVPQPSDEAYNPVLQSIGQHSQDSLEEIKFKYAHEYTAADLVWQNAWPIGLLCIFTSFVVAYVVCMNAL
ncbi:hypothetical protein EON65_13885 [archaeon]|nr:MAG: hypothetical protein EON65_13885 [archaeon]